MPIGVDAWAAIERLGGAADWLPVDADTARVLSELAAERLIEVRRVGHGRTVRLTRDGADALALRTARETARRPVARWLAKQADEAYREVDLLPSELEMLRDYLRVPARPGGADLSEVVADAYHDADNKRWLAQMTQAEAHEAGRALWLASLAGSATAKNRLARRHGIAYSPPDPSA